MRRSLGCNGGKEANKTNADEKKMWQQSSQSLICPAFFSLSTSFSRVSPRMVIKSKLRPLIDILWFKCWVTRLTNAIEIIRSHKHSILFRNVHLETFGSQWGWKMNLEWVTHSEWEWFRFTWSIPIQQNCSLFLCFHSCSILFESSRMCEELSPIWDSLRLATFPLSPFCKERRWAKANKAKPEPGDWGSKNGEMSTWRAFFLSL